MSKSRAQIEKEAVETEDVVITTEDTVAAVADTEVPVEDTTETASDVTITTDETEAVHTETATEPTEAEPELPADEVTTSVAVEDVTEKPASLVEFEPKLIQLNRAATLYGNAAGTKVVGTYKGAIRQVGVSVNGLAPIEYIVISAGNKIVKRAYIHI